MRQLSAAARSASEFAAWMLNAYHNPSAPLASLRVLLSPSSGEIINPDILAKLPQDAASYAATLANVEQDLIDFRIACDSDEDNVAVVYAAGHGVQLSKNGAILLLHDCGADTHLNELKASIDLAGVHAGFNHPYTAQTQFWFVDACRQEPAMAERYETMQAGLTLDTRRGVAKASPVFLASSTQMNAFARIGGTTLFNEALLGGLNGSFAAPPDDMTDAWHISVTQFTTRLADSVQALASAAQVEQKVDIGGKPMQAVFHVFNQPPEAMVDVSIRPVGISVNCVGTLFHRNHGTVLGADHCWPMLGTVRAGIYELLIESENPPKSYFEYVCVNPPKFKREVAFR